MVVRISGDGSIAGLTDWEATSVTHPDSADTNIALAGDGSVVFDSIPAAIQSAIDAVPVLAGIGSNVVQTVKTDTFSTTSTTFTTITGLTATITPTSASSKILVTANINMSMNNGGSSSYVRVTGGNAADFVGDNASLVRAAAFSGVRLGDRWGIEAQAYQQIINYLDSPETTSPITYGLEMRVLSSTGHVNRNGLNNGGSVPSSITLIEVAA